jgi:hypothetical protein
VKEKTVPAPTTSSQRTWSAKASALRTKVKDELQGEGDPRKREPEDPDTDKLIEKHSFEVPDSP